MTDRPVIMSAPMVRACLAGTKTQTRRLAWKPARASMIECRHGFDTCPTCDAPKPSPWQKVKPGDRLWVRENFCLDDDGDFERAIYAADDGAIEKHRARIDALGPSFPKSAADRLRKLRPAIHLPRVYSRLTLLVTAVKIERLQDINGADAKAEGAERMVMDDDGKFYSRTDGTYRCGFAGIWVWLHGAAAWDANPEVAAITFKPVRENVDKVAA